MRHNTDTLYLPIKQIYFDQIVAGTKKEEYREVKMGITASRYLQKNADGSFALNPECTEPGKDYYMDDYNNGRFPFLPKKYKYLSLAVGYAKERDTAIVEVSNITFEIARTFGKPPKFAWWIVVFHISKVIEVHRH